VAGGCLVTGGTGFAGSHLIEHLLEHESSTRAAPRETRIDAWSNPGGQRHSTADSRVRWHAVNLLDREAVRSTVAAIAPSTIYHCGGVADVNAAQTRPERSLEVNALGTLHLLDAVWEAGLDCPVLVTGSALVYRPSTSAIAEDAPLGPFNPYGVSKLAQEMVASQDRRRRTMVVRSFNHAGPRQSPAYVTSSFASQIAEIEAGLREPTLSVGNLDAARDITDVRDVVRAYRMIVERGEPGRPYNVCSGTAYRVGDLLDRLVEMARVTVRVTVDAARLRALDNPLVLGDRSRVTTEIGWTPEIPVERTLADLLDYWRARTAKA
jgi:GDP-4-dehydro-6-deoxy-D-mannose reductase